MGDAQIWLVRLLLQDNPIEPFMRTAWGWPVIESLHFVGLCLLVGAIGTFDLRLLGIGRGISIAAAHRLIPWGLFGWAINAVTGMMFLLTEPDQYIYNPAFGLKVLFMVVAGLNASAFYLTSYRRVLQANPIDAPRSARLIAAASLCLWIGVIVTGRMITFYRPLGCDGEPAGFFVTCNPR